MPLLGEISIVQPSLQIHLGTLRAQSIIHDKVLSSSFIFRSGKRLDSSWKSLNLPSKLHGDVESFKIRRGRCFISVVATFKTERSVQKHDGNEGSPMQIESANKDLEEMDEKERLRRMRISQANKGITPWNKGKKHSPETRERIRETTKIAMQNFKVKRKLADYVGHAQSEETKGKIGAAVRRGWVRRREVFKLRETCHFEWQNLIAEAARTGFAGEEDEMHWDSYEILREQIHEEWLQSVEQRKATKPKGCTRKPKSLEQRRKIAAAITAKWTNPEYRERISAAKSRNRGTTVRVERKPRMKQSNKSTQSTERNGSKRKASVSKNCSVSKAKSKNVEPKKHIVTFEDPLASSKLEMIKDIRAQRANTPPIGQNGPEKKASVSENCDGSETKSKTQESKKHNAKYEDPLASSDLEMIRAQRAAAETRKTEAIERARKLIAEAEMAMNALELTAEKSPTARASLVETREIIAEAIRSLESLKKRQSINENNGEEHELMNHAEHTNINVVLNDDSKEFVSSRYGKGHIPPQVNVEDVMKQSGTSSPIEQPSPNEKNTSNGVLDKKAEEEAPPKSSTKTKKWVRGRLVEVLEEVADWSLSKKYSEEVEDWNLSKQEVSEEEEEVSEEVEDWSLSEEEEVSEEVDDWSLSEEVSEEVDCRRLQ